MRQKATVQAYGAPAGGWGSLNAVAHILTQEEVAILGSEILRSPPEDDGNFELITMRADGQFNTTIYNEDDRFRGTRGGRYVVFMNPADMASLGLRQGDLATLSTVADDAVELSVGELQLVAYDIPRKSLAGYYPELAFRRRQQGAGREIDSSWNFQG